MFLKRRNCDPAERYPSEHIKADTKGASLRVDLLNRFIPFEMPDSTAYRFDPHC
jgi:hypothetical protein